MAIQLIAERKRHTMDMKTFYMWILQGLVGMGILGLFAGCATVKILPVEQTGRVEAGAQYAHSSAPRTGCNTAEIYLENHGTETLVFEAPVLNGAALPPMRAKASSALDTVTLDGHALPLAVGELKPDREVVWWQYYPSPELKPGETVACQLNFRVLPTFQSIPSAELMPTTNTPPSARKSFPWVCWPR